jgi:hypothetical protein
MKNPRFRNYLKRNDGDGTISPIAVGAASAGFAMDVGLGLVFSAVVAALLWL